MKDKTKVNYRGRHRSVLGKFSLAVGLLTVFFLVFLILYGRSHDAKTLGVPGVLNGLLAIAGTICATAARRETPFLDGYALAGMIVNLTMAIVTFGLILVGAAL